MTGPTWRTTAFVAFCFAVGIGIVLVTYFFVRDSIRSEGLTDPLAWLFGVAIGVALLVTVLSAVLAAREDTQRRERAMQLQTDERQLATQAKGGELELAQLWALTQRRIDFYHEIALNQSRRSFLTGQISMLIGFGCVVFLGVRAAWAPNATAAIVTGAVGAVGAALSAFIGATFIKSQIEATSQLRSFFGQPVDSIRVLGAERLVETLPEAERSAAVQQIVKSLAFTTTSGGQTPTA